MHLPLISALFLSTLTLTLTNAFPTLSPRQSTPTPSNITFHVTNFTAFMHDQTIDGAQSNLSFHVVDTRRGLEASADCYIPPTYFSLYAITALYEFCGNEDVKNEFAFMFEEGTVSVRRVWSEGNKSWTGSASMNPYWKEGTNATVMPTGRLFEHKGEWLFPVNRLSETTPR